MTGYGGWSWVSKTRVPRFVPKLPGNTNVNYRQELEGKCQTGQISTICSPAGTFGLFLFLSSFSLLPFIAAKMNKENAAACTNKQITSTTEKQTAQTVADQEGERETISGSAQTTSSEDHNRQTSNEEGNLKGEQQETNEEEKNGDEKIEVDPCPETMSSPEKGKCSTRNELTSVFGICRLLIENVFPPSVTDKAECEDTTSPPAQHERNELMEEVKHPKKEEINTSKPFCDVVNVSEGFQLRTAYKKKVKPSKLDGLLERRVKQFTLEEKQRLERMRQVALLAKTAAMRSAHIKTEGPTIGKQLPALTPCAKEEKDESLHAKDNVVKKLDFEQEQMEMKVENLDIKLDATTPKQMEVNAMHGNGGEAHKEVNGSSLATTELSCKNNCVSDAIEGKETVQTVGENGKKRGYEEIEQGGGQSEAESMVTDPSKTCPVQVNGRIGVPDPADSNINSDQACQVQGDIKESVRSLMNGNLSQEDMSNMCHPPPSKVPKLENHVAEKGDALKKSEGVTMNSEGAASLKLPSSSPHCLNSNSTDSEDANATSEGSQNAPQSGGLSQAASSTVPTTTTTQPSLKVAIPPKANTTVAAPASAAASSMTISKEYSTRDRVSLLKFSKSKKARSGTALPSYRKFVTKSSKKSIFILPNDDLKRLARRGSIREVPIFNYSAKPAPDIWPYPSPRPTFGITWRLASIFSLILHILCGTELKASDIRISFLL